MRELKWNEYDFVECLGVLGNFDEDSVLYTFKVEKDDLILEIIICHYESFVQIFLSQKNSDAPFFKFSFLVRNEIRYVSERNSSFLEFSDCIVSNYYDSDIFDKNRCSTYSIFQIHTFPKFWLNFS
jgi:hypothetical protein